MIAGIFAGSINFAIIYTVSGNIGVSLVVALVTLAVAKLAQ